MARIKDLYYGQILPALEAGVGVFQYYAGPPSVKNRYQHGTGGRSHKREIARKRCRGN